MAEEGTRESVFNSASTYDLLLAFDSQQEQRVGTYNRFEGAFFAFLESKDFESYKQQCAKITQIFSIISSDIKDIEAALRNKGQIAAADIICEIQNFEKQKLHLTSKQQVIRTEKSALPDEDTSQVDEMLRETNKELGGITSGINEKLEELRFETEEARAQQSDNNSE
eukprot:TRINITY_DN2412_c0_g1_i1.p1 TRINITY_DN2412_c0_g1~~TRINITY_DN2412_c0_g1_i1.p1  ORF type:complete len:168 (-),score=40.95 TRINITY_DN2412_c0_g1_i1:448-951(-)